MKKNYDVIIVGGGGGGAILALFLARHGVNVLILERNKDQHNDFRSEILHPNGQKILHELGILDSLSSSVIYPTYQFDFFRIGAGRLCTFDYRDLPVPHNVALTTFSCPLHLSVLDAIAQEETLTILYGACFKKLIYDHDTVAGVVVELDDQIYEVHAQLVVGADGVASEVRRALRINAEVYQYPEGYLLGILERPPGFEHRSSYYIGKGEIFGLLPVPNDQLYYFYLLPNAVRADLDEEGFEQIKDSMINIEPRLAGYTKGLTHLGQTLFRPCFRVRARSWVANGAVLIGDAAHAMNPHVSQGRMQAMQDAQVLAKVVLDCLNRGDCSASLLKVFERERRPHVEMLQRLGDEQTFFWNSRYSSIHWIVDRVLKKLDHNERLRFQVMETTAGLRDKPPFNFTDRLLAAGLLPD